MLSWVHAATVPGGGILSTSLPRMILNQGVCVCGEGVGGLRCILFSLSTENKFYPYISVYMK